MGLCCCEAGPKARIISGKNLSVMQLRSSASHYPLQRSITSGVVQGILITTPVYFNSSVTKFSGCCHSAVATTSGRLLCKERELLDFTALNKLLFVRLAFGVLRPAFHCSVFIKMN